LNVLAHAVIVKKRESEEGGGGEERRGEDCAAFGISDRETREDTILLTSWAARLAGKGYASRDLKP